MAKYTAGSSLIERGQLLTGGHLCPCDHGRARPCSRGIRHGGQQCSSVGVNGRGEQRISGRYLDQSSQVDDEYSMAQMPDDRQIVADEQHRGTEFPLQIEQQIDDLSLDGHIQRTDRLIAYQ